MMKVSAANPAPKAIGKPTTAPRARSTPSLMLLAMASGALLWASFYPLNWGWLGWVALVPLLGLVRARARPLRIYGAGLICGLAFFIPALQWMRAADDRMYFAWLPLAFYCSLYFPAAIFFLRYLYQRTRLPLVITVPIVWTAFEFLRAHLISGFPWYYLAHTQHEVLPLIQISDVTGAYGLSFLIAATNALIFELLRKWEWFRQLSEPGLRPEGARIPMSFQVLGVLALFSAVLVYGLVRMHEENFKIGPRVLLVQPNVPQQIRNDATGAEDSARLVMSRYRDLTQKGLNEGLKPYLIVWPESSLPETWYELSERLHDKRPDVAMYAAESHAEAIRLARVWHTDFLVGATCVRFEDEKTSERFNSAVFIREDGKIGGRYNKIHRVPVGEYLPFRDTFPWMDTFSPYPFDYSVRPGVTLNRFELGEFTFGVLICYEDTDPTLARQYALTGADGKPVDFLVNISNDGWFDGTSEHDQHLATCRFRAVEARRTIARSVNMGISAVIDGSGRAIALPGDSIAGSKKMEGLIACNLPIDDRQSYYAQFGDWLPWACWIGIAGAVVFGWVRRLTSSNPSSVSSGGAGASP